MYGRNCLPLFVHSKAFFVSTQLAGVREIGTRLTSDGSSQFCNSLCVSQRCIGVGVCRGILQHGINLVGDSVVHFLVDIVHQLAPCVGHGVIVLYLALALQSLTLVQILVVCLGILRALVLDDHIRACPGTALARQLQLCPLGVVLRVTGMAGLEHALQRRCQQVCPRL